MALAIFGQAIAMKNKILTISLLLIFLCVIKLLHVYFTGELSFHDYFHIVYNITDYHLPF